MWMLLIGLCEFGRVWLCLVSSLIEKKKSEQKLMEKNPSHNMQTTWLGH